jgi:hypothetical protein
MAATKDRKSGGGGGVATLRAIDGGVPDAHEPTGVEVLHEVAVFTRRAADRLPPREARLALELFRLAEDLDGTAAEEGE